MGENKLSEKAVIAQFMRTVREREHLTQSELGKGAGLGQDGIARIEADEGPLPRLDAIARILAGAVMNCSYGRLRKAQP